MDRWGRARGVLAPVGLFALAVGVRALPWRTVLLEGRVQPFGNDSFYHLRRISYSVRNFPRVLEFDPYINFPDGAKPIWTPLFDWLAALLVMPFAPEGSAGGIERAAIWIPPLLGGLTVVVLYRLARRHFGRSVALLAGALLSVLSAHFWYSQLGFVDHHAAVALTSTLLLAAGMGLLSQVSPETLERGALWRESLLTGIALGAALVTWPGSLLQVALVEGGLLLVLLGQRGRSAAVGFALRVSAVQAVGFALVLPFSATGGWPQWSPFSPVVLSRFQPWMFGVLGTWGLACAALWRETRAGSTRGRRIAVGAATGFGLLLASGWLFPHLAIGAADAWRWLGKAEHFQSSVAESQPLFFDRGRFTLEIASSRLSLFIYLFPLIAVAAAREMRCGRPRAHLFLLLGWSVALFAVALLQRRFFNSLSVPLALLAAWSTTAAYRAIPPLWLGTAARRGGVRAALGGIVLLLMWPSLATYRMHLGNELRAARGQPIEVTRLFAERRVVVDAALWLRRNTPETSGWVRPDRRPEYGVIGPWTVGHVIEYAARRPAVTDNFGDDLGGENLQLARRYFQSAEPEATALLDRLKVRYVIAQERHQFLGERPPESSLFRSLYFRDGSEPAGDLAEAGRDGVRALERHRLVFESQPLRGGGADRQSMYKIFEYVPGARITGRAAAGSVVRASLTLRTNRGREIRYASRTAAGEEGRYALRVPYANVGGPGAVKVGAHYWLECGGERAAVRIEEDAVARGAEVEGPDLCATPTSRVRSVPREVAAAWGGRGRPAPAGALPGGARAGPPPTRP